MKVFKRDLRHGTVRLGVENLDDLWYLSNIVRAGDAASMYAVRRVKDKDGGLRSSGGERRGFMLSLRVEKTELNYDSGVLRVSGSITRGPEDLVSIGSHHTFSVEAGSDLTLVKDSWSSSDLKMLKDAGESSLRPKVVVAVVDEGDACVGLVRDSGIKYYDLSEIVGGKYDSSRRAEQKNKFYGHLAEFMDNLGASEQVQSYVVAGPGFEKEYFLGYLREKHPGLAGKAVLENTGSHGRAGVNEVLKRGALDRILEKVSSARDMKYIEELMEHIGRDTGLAAYGPSDVESTVNSGAAEKLLISNKALMEYRTRLEQLMDVMRKTRGIVHIINSDSDAGKQLDSLGGVAAVLRFRINQ